MRVVLPLTLALLAVLSPIATAAPGWCPARDAWVDDCSTPTLIVTYRHGGVTCGDNNHGTVMIVPGDFGWNITVSECTHSGTAQGDISIGGAENTLPVVGNVTIAAPGPSGRITSLFFSTDTLRVASVHSIAKSVTSGGQLWVSGEIGGNLGSSATGTAMTADAIHQAGGSFTGLRVRGSVLGNINLLGPHAFSFDQIEGLVVWRNLLGNVYAQGGGIRSIFVGDLSVTGDRGRIGTMGGVPFNIHSVSDIAEIQAGEINANIVAGANFTGIQGATDARITLVRTRTDRGSGDFAGSIDAYDLGPATYLGGAGNQGDIRIDNDFGTEASAGEISLRSPLRNYSLVEEPTDGSGVVRRIQIGRSFRKGSISLPEDGLRGQILINTRDAGGIWHPTDAVVQVGPNAPALTNAGYGVHRADIGGGSVGRAEYLLHGADCEPAQNSVVLVPGNGANWQGAGDPTCEDLLTTAQSISIAYVQLYGPVTAAANAMPLIVKRGPIGGTLVDVSSDYEAVILSDAEPGYSTNLRSNRIKFQRKEVVVNSQSVRPDFGTNVEYEVTPSAALKCIGVTGEPRPSFTYRFVVRFDCQRTLVGEYDQNDDGVLDGWDLVQWLNEPTDVNGDNATSAADIWVLTHVIEEYNSAP